MPYCVRITFSGPTNIADVTLWEALEQAGLVRTAADGLTYDLLAPASVSLANQGAWAHGVVERIAGFREDWTVEAVEEEEA
jgi:hypothetical protein